MLEFFREKMQSTFAMILVVFFCAVFPFGGGAGFQWQVR